MRILEHSQAHWSVLEGKRMHRGRGGIGAHKHGVSGKPGHNRDMMQMARELQRQAERLQELKRVHKGPVFDSVQELMRASRRKRRG